MSLTGSILDYFIVFFSGIIVSFTPCVYPLIPILVASIGAINTESRRISGFFLSLVYVLGMAISYSVLAAIAAISGSLFGSIQQSPWVYTMIGSVLFGSALMMFDLVPVPTINFQGKIKPRGYFSIFILGVVSGFMVGPCTAPVLGSLLIFVASKQSVIYGVSLLFVFAFGLGASLILAGTFSGFLTSLPRTGVWMSILKKIVGVVLILISLYYFFQAGIVASGSLGVLTKG